MEWEMVVVERVVILDEVVAKVLVVVVLVFLEQARLPVFLVVATGVETAVPLVRVFLQPLRQLLFPLFPPLRLFLFFRRLFFPPPSPYTVPSLLRVLQVVLVFVLGCPCVLRAGRTNVSVSSSLY